MPVFMPPPASPQAVEYAKPPKGGAAVSITSHDYRYVVTGNTLLPAARLEAVLRAATDPKAALAALLKLYHRHGYTLVAITGQVDGRAVTVNVFEGMITEFDVPSPLAPYFAGVQWRPALRKSDLIRDQILAGSYAARSGDDVRVNLSPAANPGGTRLTVSRPARQGYFPVSGVLTFGNYGSRYASGYVAGGNVAANVTHGIRITASYTQGLPGLRAISLGSNYYQNGTGASIVTPYGIYGFEAQWTHFRLGKATYPLNPDGNIFTYAFTGTQLLYADASTRVTTNEGVHHLRYKETVFDGFFTLADQHYNYLSVGARANKAITLDGLAGNIDGGLTFNMGLSTASGTLVDGVPGLPTPHFRYTNASFQYRQALPYAFGARLSAQGQWAVNTLPAQQEFVLGGLGNLAAWEPGVIAGDSGYVARLELDGPKLSRNGISAQLGGFVETGGATFTTPPRGTAPWRTLSDIGAMLRLDLPRGFSATAMAATPIQDSGFNAVGRRDLALNRLDAFFVVQKDF